MHSHPLSLDVGMEQGTSQNEHFCDVCGELVEGLCYRCKDCEFNVHPLCTQLPQQLCHARHTIHPLKLEKISSSTSCAVCHVCAGACDSWRYRCEICGFDIHMECLLVPCDHPPTQRSISRRWPPPACDLPTQRTIPKCGPSTDPPQPPLAPPPHYVAYDPYRVSPCPSLYNTYNYVNQFPPCGRTCLPMPQAAVSSVKGSNTQLLPYNGACRGLAPSPSPNNMYNYVNHDSPCGPPLPHYGAYPYMPSGPSPYNMYVNSVQSYGLPLPLPHYGAYTYGMIPSGPNPYHNNYANQAVEGGATHGRKRKMIYKIIKQLTLGVASSAIFALISG
ncbi:hypothetical protein F0562_016675 [Nyssa sinensis]|uniref:Phorbol-ester/DAG-type domain-containing protein n=1 Tax=Nyssa sinensis TaxID=561372 RepID=A0A5J4ZFE4_9ASTE|nr:hypothetical protein F0562_016675 [Nyssa sinensis]